MKLFRNAALALSAAVLATTGMCATPAQAIVGGSDVTLGEAPYMAGLTEGSSFAFCGGSLISNQYVLTSAHCVTGKAPTSLQVLLGDLDYKNKSDSPKAALYPVEAYMVHPNFNANTNLNDIALIKLRRPATLNDAVRPIQLDTIASSHAGKTVEALGWGSASYGGPVSSRLRKVPLSVVPPKECRTTYPQLNGSTQLCTYTAGSDTCQYDSGGPVVEPADGRPILIGVITASSGCATSSPTIHTRVAAYRQWITAATGPLSVP
ncbi:serine protease [Streptomyces sp. NPDC053728]|uniref:serine protease n=1 Tax=Streptomyces sp. NPDC053728 TaxID=3155534 RepID=UPI003439B637